ncbi:hypothetical protein VB774_00040 [Pseudanabaena galeata UHCC 0370]|jgi:hypothetical protein|uniref:DUF2281 domain-containing protein n=1 Tax=Pseudanabaena galeata UHCC 0370 TaxID=3110310 RepID=A0ABU5TCM5_9CYAN|nr:hypothetical protein [Pseudanabaena galeata]MEA5475997.1 hypothetical protein [Pseudanabaena galeata UHCC 0370]
MKATVTIEQRIIELVRSLPLVKQKQILDFAEFIGNQNKQKDTLNPDRQSSISALELAGDLIGSLDIGGDISLQKHELKNQNLA